MTEWKELLTLVASFIAAAFGILRMTLSQNKLYLERTIGVLEASLNRQNEVITEFHRTLDKLADNVGENTTLTRTVSDWIRIERFNEGG